jgi:hypothetical protein
MKTFICLGALWLAAMTLSAADSPANISGKWSGSFTVTGAGGESQHDTAFVIFQQKGTELTGSGGPDETQQWPILKGKVEGNRITFEVQSEGPLYKVDVMLVGDHIKGDVSVVDGGQTSQAKVDLTRVK